MMVTPLKLSFSDLPFLVILSEAKDLLLLNSIRGARAVFLLRKGGFTQ